MLLYKLGYFATSLAGHDKGRVYMIVSEEGEKLGLCDGTHRCLNNPKYKKKKHVQMMRSERMAEAFPELITSEDGNLRIREAIADLEKEKKKTIQEEK
ncbi:MAG: hypothetical protein Q4E53_10895 [Eubacteriales bacterium]|nr:hypothetical protein [Eubacteriales bacterium]